METYEVLLSEIALSEIDEIYGYISGVLKEPDIAVSLADEIERSILSLRQIPYRFPERTVGIYANKGYRQMLVKNYLVIYRVDERKKQVIILTVRYAKRDL